MTGLVIFDGVCSFCERSVQFILRHETGPGLRFAPIQSNMGARMARDHGFDPDDARTFVLVEGGRAYVRSAAAIRVACHLRWPWRVLAAIWIVPRPLRDWAYDRIAANRYRWFGRKDSCMVPTPEQMRRFDQD
ncbi:MAG: thiol-disulfide oxidoreductase DCC family protein [Pseudomonas sp.]|uniref:thiol-disulfide oxidoreductase DCC family protein n=1 Tax=Pseudomonas sp. TaxID=306 RepID=UPI00122B38E3|nr:thiol-disulfide oxidoreductase DCC family protein [Pseudomonas sp.]RZI70590.1 MAG: thiol-disulfide oxidoreductase DCC family protein [Pseudomonas sp.]